jgi:ACR3 family arsenite efflux pump ArsB
MRHVIYFFRMLGFISTLIVVCFYLGYKTAQPKCYTVASVFTEQCR